MKLVYFKFSPNLKDRPFIPMIYKSPTPIFAAKIMIREACAHRHEIVEALFEELGIYKE